MELALYFDGPFDGNHFEVGFSNGFANDFLADAFVSRDHFDITAFHVDCGFHNAWLCNEFLLELATAARAQSAFDANHPLDLPLFQGRSRCAETNHSCQAANHKLSSFHISPHGALNSGRYAAQARSCFAEKYSRVGVHVNSMKHRWLFQR